MAMWSWRNRHFSANKFPPTWAYKPHSHLEALALLSLRVWHTPGAQATKSPGGWSGKWICVSHHLIYFQCTVPGHTSPYLWLPKLMVGILRGHVLFFPKAEWICRGSSPLWKEEHKSSSYTGWQAQLRSVLPTALGEIMLVFCQKDFLCKGEQLPGTSAHGVHMTVHLFSTFKCKPAALSQFLCTREYLHSHLTCSHHHHTQCRATEPFLHSTSPHTSLLMTA